MDTRVVRPKNSNATILTENDVKDIRKLYREGEYKICKLSSMFRVGTKRIMNILNGHTEEEIGGHENREKTILSRVGTRESSEISEESNNDELTRLMAEVKADNARIMEKRDRRLQKNSKIIMDGL